jgi:MFS family permease
MVRYTSFWGRGLAFLIFIWFIWFISFVLRAIFSPLLPLIEDEFLIAHARATSIYAFVSLGYAISLFFSGTFAGLLGYRKSILLSVVVLGGVFCVIPTVRTFYVFYPLSFILGLAAGMYLPSIIPLITDYYEERLWGKAIAAHGSAPSAAILAAPFIALFLLSFVPWRTAFVVLGIVTLACAGTFYFVTQEVGTEKAKSFFLGRIFKRRAFWIMGSVWIFSAGCNVGLYLVIPLYLIKELSLGMEYANTMFGASRLGGVGLTVLSGFLVDRFSLKKSMFFLMLLTGILTMLLTVRDIGLIKIFLFVQAAVSPVVFPVGLSAIPELFKKEETGQATGFIVTLGMIGTGVIPYLLGLSGDYLTFRFGIFLLGLLTMLSSGFILFMKDLR